MPKTSSVKKIIAAVGLAALLSGSSAFYIAYHIIHPKRRQQKETPADFGLAYKKIELKSKDGTRLKGWLIKAENPKGIIVVSHGYSFDKQSMLSAAKELYKNSYSSLLFDFRAHGESGGHTTTIGASESEDLLAAIKFAKKNSSKVGLFGVSMGAAASIMAAPKVKGLVAIVADSSFARLGEIVHRNSYDVTNLIIKFMELQGVDVEKSQPIKYIRGVGSPIMLVHGEKDNVVPAKDSLDLFKKAKQPKELWIVKGGEHGRSYFANKKHYSEKLIRFFDKYFLP